ncbi:GvpL/GvpF family gas vesicle protein [Peribacillus deserti]|uniref:Gas vesicle protein GvpL n=1 Tax=Peribacillus deserti TaxID=673318 RepID=A0A2N5M5P7_9BACI|nr:GvpL/GvpF family gas vesicle protein [Peribacillus deserti]PLT29680.1 gas vesicle protein GvpL [Peribacillus deserti]
MDGLIYLYGLIPAHESRERTLPSLKGFDGRGEIYTIPIGSITALVCNLDPHEYSEDSIKDKTNNDMEWLQEKAFHHHETVLKLSKMYTIIPLKFCTLYMNQTSLEKTVRDHEAKMMDTFELLTGNEEWNLKIYCDDELLKTKVSQNNPVLEAKRAEISELPKGKQFFEKKKLDKLLESELEEEKNKVSEKIHEHLKEFALKGNVKKTWGSNVTGRKDDMTWNGVYLIGDSKVEEFLGQIQQYEKDMKETGWRFEASGPWPAYHFSSFSK